MPTPASPTRDDLAQSPPRDREREPVAGRRFAQRVPCLLARPQKRPLRISRRSDHLHGTHETTGNFHEIDTARNRRGHRPDRCRGDHRQSVSSPPPPGQLGDPEKQLYLNPIRLLVHSEPRRVAAPVEERNPASRPRITALGGSHRDFSRSSEVAVDDGKKPGPPASVSYDVIRSLDSDRKYARFPTQNSPIPWPSQKEASPAPRVQGVKGRPAFRRVLLVHL